MKAEIISVGTELLMGQIVNTDSAYLSAKLPECGVYTLFHTTVGDNMTRLQEAIEIALDRVDLVFLTGGLGPTQDDITKEALSKVLDLELVYHDSIMKSIEKYFTRLKLENRKVHMAENNKKQAYYPKGSIILFNHRGTAPGSITETIWNNDKKTIVMLPGPPHELQGIFEDYLIDYFLKKNNESLKSVYLRLFGIGESAMEEIITDLIEKQENPTIAPYAKPGEVTLRVTARYSKEEDNADLILKPLLDTLYERLGDYIYSDKNQELKEVVANLLIERDLKLSLAESCTGGLLSAELTDVPGVSQVYLGSVTAYSNDIKANVLKVKKESLDKHGAVSSQVATEMAKGILSLYNSDIGISITGIAGPGGATKNKPLGLVYICLSDKKDYEVHKFVFNGNRDRVRRFASLHALNILRKYLLKKG